MGSWSNYFYRLSYGAKGTSEYTNFNTGIGSADTELKSCHDHRVLTSNAHGLVFTGPGAGGGLDADKLDGLHAYELSAAAGSADYATEAGSAAEAYYATNAASATEASYTTSASSADYATLAGSADYATLSSSADYSTVAGSAGDADTLDGYSAESFMMSGDLTGYALLSGRSGGQILIGGAGSGENLTLQSTSHATKGKINLDDDGKGNNWTGLFPGATKCFVTVSEEFISSDGAAANPCWGLLSYVENNNSPADVVGLGGIAKAMTADDAVWAGCLIATCGAVSGVKLVGLEIDMEPHASATSLSSSSAGMCLNAFNIDIPGPAIHIGGVSSGTFNNGILIGGIKSDGAGICPEGSAGMDSLLNSSSGVYGSDAVVLSNTHKIRFKGTAAAHAKIYNDASDNLRIVGPTNYIIFRNNADTASLVSISSDGHMNLEVGVYKNLGLQVVGARVIDARCDDTVDSTYGSEEAGVLDALRDAMIAHGLIAAA